MQWGGVVVAARRWGYNQEVCLKLEDVLVSLSIGWGWRLRRRSCTRRQNRPFNETHIVSKRGLCIIGTAGFVTAKIILRLIRFDINVKERLHHVHDARTLHMVTFGICIIRLCAGRKTIFSHWAQYRIQLGLRQVHLFTLSLLDHLLLLCRRKLPCIHHRLNVILILQIFCNSLLNWLVIPLIRFLEMRRSLPR